MPDGITTATGDDDDDDGILPHSMIDRSNRGIKLDVVMRSEAPASDLG